MCKYAFTVCVCVCVCAGVEIRAGHLACWAKLALAGQCPGLGENYIPGGQTTWKQYKKHTTQETNFSSEDEILCVQPNFRSVWPKLGHVVLANWNPSFHP